MNLRSLLLTLTLSACDPVEALRTEPTQGSTLALTFANGGLTMSPGESVQLQVTPTDGAGQPFTGVFSISWSSSAPAVASIGSTAQLNALTSGSAVVTARATRLDTGASATASLTVTVGQVTPTPMPPSPPVVPAAGGLVAAYGFSEASGTRVGDASSAGRSGTVSGAPGWTAGKFGTGLAFSSASQWVSMGDVAALDGLAGLTVSAWARTTETGEKHIVGKSRCDGVGNGGPFELGTGFFTSGRATMLVYHSTGFVYVESPTSVADGAWHHLTGTYDGVTVKVYVDGVLAATKSTPQLQLPATSNSLELGGHCNGNSYFWNGAIDEVRLYSRALSAAEISTDMNNPVGPAISAPLDAGTGLVDAGVGGMGPSYSTDFSLTEAPISEGGRWVQQGGTSGLDWTNVRTGGGIAYGTQTGLLQAYDDSIALLSGYGPNQRVSAVLHFAGNLATATNTHEAELILRGSYTPHYQRLYECTFGYHDATGWYVDIVVLDGSLGTFRSIGVPTGNPLPVIRDGTAVSAQIIGDLITVSVGGVAVLTARDSTIASGQPGIGFFWRGTENITDLGFTSFSAVGL